MPALLTRMSTRPNALTVSSRARSTSVRLVTSQATAITLPRVLSSAAVFPANGLSRSQIAPAAPESRKRSVIARPRPCAPPVTTAKRPDRSILLGMALPPLECGHVLAKRAAARERRIVRGGLCTAPLKGAPISSNRCARGPRRSPREAREAQAPSPSRTEGTHASRALFCFSPRALVADRHRAGADDSGRAPPRDLRGVRGYPFPAKRGGIRIEPS